MAQSRPKRILIVDDDEDVRILFRATLPPDAYEVAEAATISEAWDRLSDSHVDLIVLDIGLPDGNGLDLCQVIRQDHRLGALPIIILTGDSSATGHIQGYQKGADRYVAKPYRPSEMLETIRYLIAHS